jgi:RPA family protein
MPELQQNTFQKRSVACKVRIYDILNGNFVKDDSSAGYVSIGNLNIYRVNVIANLVFKSERANSANVIIDDGTGRITLRIFENMDIFSKADIGDFVNIIGRVREFGDERYIIPEIIKKVDNIAWVNLRKLELKNIDFGNVKNKISAVESPQTISEEIYLLIKILDNGSGADFDAVIKNSKNNDAEQAISRLLENGDIFEVTPGKLKVLE